MLTHTLERLVWSVRLDVRKLGGHSSRHLLRLLHQVEDEGGREKPPHACQVQPLESNELSKGDAPVHAVGEVAHCPHVGRPMTTPQGCGQDP